MTTETQQPIVLNIQLNLSQLSVILSTLGKLPYENISPLIDHIRDQANHQLGEMQQSTQLDAMNPSTDDPSLLPTETPTTVQ